MESSVDRNSAAFFDLLFIWHLQFVMRGRMPCMVFRFVWYLIVGLVAGTVAKFLTQVHLGLGRTLLLGVAGSLIGGLIARLFSRTPADRPFHPAGCILSIVGAIIIIYVGVVLGR